MKSKPFILIASSAVICAIVAILIIPAPSENEESSEPSQPVAKKPLPTQVQSTNDLPTKRVRAEKIPAGALPNERLITFPSQQALEEFLASTEGSNLTIIGRSNYTNTLRVGFNNSRDLKNFLPAGAETAFNFPVNNSPIEDGVLNPNATPFNGRVKEWLGITGDNSQWGSGVSVAVIDSGLLPHSALGDIEVFSVAGDPNNPDLNPHGTAMTSLWREGEGVIPSIAPAVDLTSIQVSDDDGNASLFSLAEAIFLATDQGAQIIPISMGSTSTNPLLDQAISYAVDNGSLIIASAGNSGTDTPFYPAAHPDTISVAALDFNRNYPGFSNTGDSIDLAAPGVGLVTAGVNDQFFLNTGTSPAAQITGNVIAATMSELGISDPYEAWEIVDSNLNELGVSGEDNIFGNGYPQLDVILNHDQPGRFDAAIASTIVVTQPNSSEGEIQIVVSNPGTEQLNRASLEFEVEGQRFSTPVPDIEAGGTHDFTIPLPIPSNTDVVTVSSEIILPNGQQDVRPRDNAVRATFSTGN